MTFRLLLVPLLGASLWGQSPPVPTAFQDLYNSLQQQLNAFNGTVLAGWNATKSPVDFSAELLTANCNRGLQLLNSATRPGYLLELSRLKALGATTVTVCASFPILYPSFYQFNGDPADYQRMLAFYQQLVADVHGQGMKIAIESGAMLTGVYSGGSGFNLAGYYPTLGQQAYIDGRTQVIVALAQMQPDYLALGSEPDTEASLTGQAWVNTPTGWGSLIGAFVTMLNTQGLGNVHTTAGVGTWLNNGSDYLRAIAAAAPKLWYFDFHVYPVNLTIPQNTLALLDLAVVLGKPATIFEAWLLKERDSEFTGINTASDPTIFARDTYSFWAPLDQQFLTVMVEMAHSKQVKALSAFWSTYFYAYLDYNQVKGLAPSDVIAQSGQAAAAAIVAGQETSTAVTYQNLIAPTAFSSATTVSGASFLKGFVAPQSVVSIFGTNLARDLTVSPSAALPVSLDNVSVTATDVSGKQAPATLYFVSSGQINAVLPAPMANGNGTLLITGPNGPNAVSTISVAAVAPALFSANSNGTGPAAAVVSRLNADGSGSTGLTFQCGSSPGTCVNVPIDVSDPTAQVVVAFYGTGIRNATSLLSVSAKLNGATLPVQYAGPQSQYPGMDQLNVQIPFSVAGQGERAIQLTVNGVAANAVTINIK